MDNDERAEAMRQAVEEAKAEMRKKSKHGSGGLPKLSMPPMPKLAFPKFERPKLGKKSEEPDAEPNHAPEDDEGNGGDAKGFPFGKWKDLLHTKPGRFAAVAGGGVLALIFLSMIVSGIFSRVSEKSAQYEITDAILNIYESPDVSSGYAYDAYVEITNTSEENIYLKDVSFLIRDENKDRVSLDKNINIFPAVIAPGDKGYLFNRFGTELDGDNIWNPDLKFTLEAAFTAEVAETQPYSYPTANVQVDAGYYGQRMTGSVMNDTSKEVKQICVVGMCYNEDGHCTGISWKFLSDVEAHMSVNFKFDPINMIRAWRNEPIVDYQVYAYAG